MTYFSESAESGPDAPQHLTVSQLHLKAAEYLDHASRLHREAAKLHAVGESRAADLQVLMARYQLAKVAAHVVEAGKQVRPEAAVSDTSWYPPLDAHLFNGSAAHGQASAGSRVA